MINFDTNSKYIDGRANAYYKGFVVDEPFYKGYVKAVRDLQTVLDEANRELFENDDMPPVIKKALKQTTEKVAEYVGDAMEFCVGETVINMIDAMPAKEWTNKRDKLFGDSDEE